MGGIERKKIWTGIILTPPLIALIIWGPPLVLILMVLSATLLGLLEYYTLVLPRARRIEQFVGIGSGLLLSVFLVFGNLSRFPLLLVLLLLTLVVLSMGTSRDLTSAMGKIASMLFGILYIGFLLSHVALIRNLTDGRAWTLFLILTVWAGDIFAFSTGFFFGRHKLYPKISPKKSYEGLFGGLLGSILIARGYAFFFMPELGTGNCVLLATGIGVLGQIGDFSESMLKRSVQVKDSGTLFPGHGGMLDRIDSFLFASPFLHYAILHLREGIS